MTRRYLIEKEFDNLHAAVVFIHPYLRNGHFAGVAKFKGKWIARVKRKN